jgi:Leucine Rich repeat
MIGLSRLCFRRGCAIWARTKKREPSTMTIHEHAEVFAGKPVIQWEDDAEFDPAKNAVRITIDYDAADEGKTWAAAFAQFLESPGADKTTALIVGDWGQTATGSESGPVVKALVAYCQKLPMLDALFLGDILSEESEISWITQSDVGPLFHAYPKLRELIIRGGNSLSIGSVRHGGLEKLTIQTGGLNGSVVRQVLSCGFPELNHLELWLGEENYGATSTIGDLQPLFTGRLFPKLKYLGLKNTVLSDQIALAIAPAPVLNQLETLDLSMGTLGDNGVRALAESPVIGKLKHLDIKHHYASKALVDLLESKVKFLAADPPQEPYKSRNGELHRYISVGE